MADPEVAPLSAEVKAQRAASFGTAAAHYERYRPGPPAAAVEWILPARVHTVVDLGAGTGALSRLLVEWADDVVAVEPDDADARRPRRRGARCARRRGTW